MFHFYGKKTASSFIAEKSTAAFKWTSEALVKKESYIMFLINHLFLHSLVDFSLSLEFSKSLVKRYTVMISHSRERYPPVSPDGSVSPCCEVKFKMFC